MRIRGLRKPFFSKGDRAALCCPANLDFKHLPDDMHAGDEKLELSFELPRGCYATLIVKRVQAAVRDKAGGKQPASQLDVVP
jgi:tRNA pseudouridine13 synthase